MKKLSNGVRLIWLMHLNGLHTQNSRQKKNELIFSYFNVLYDKNEIKGLFLPKIYVAFLHCKTDAACFRS